ncbi:hypothetical protein FAK_40360 [Desulfoferula mesophila]|uniref:Transposase n=1 Tax=Desulfoferula mesophila TaxID=3058419 RepID=A0AAU9EM43_9BACT|nr:hypothetical protein FAK_40360 [Desulfoferula mesophilus]
MTIKPWLSIDLTERCVFSLDEQSKEMYLAETDDLARFDEVRALAGWQVLICILAMNGSDWLGLGSFTGY